MSDTSRLDTIRTTPLGKLTGPDVAALVRRVVAVHRDQGKVPATKFSSHI